MIENLVRRGLLRDSAKGSQLIFFGEYTPKLIPMRLLGTIAAGRPIEAITEEEIIYVPENFAVFGQENFVLRVRGDSMKDEDIRDGDLIICIERVEAHNGETVVALVDGESTLKKFYREGNKIRLQPSNPEFAPIIVPAHKLIIQGIVVGIYRRP